MGMFRTVECELHCDACGLAYVEGVQFKTGSDGLETYIEGECIPTDDDLRADRAYRGVAFRYCRACSSEFGRVEARAHYEAIADLVEEGRLRFTMRGSTEQVDADTIRAKGMHAPANGDGVIVCSHDLHLDRRELIASWLGHDLEGHGDAWLSYVEAYNARLDRLLHRAGWLYGRHDLREDLVVSLDGGRRIRVRRPDAPGASPPGPEGRLCPLDSPPPVVPQ